MPGPAPTPVTGDTALPARVDVVVVGGGVIGAMSALELAERGLSVALCEKGEIGAEQSSRNWGWVRIAGRDPREIPLMVNALAAWEGMDKRVRRATGYTRTGSVYATNSEKKLAGFEAWSRFVKERGMVCNIVRGADLDALLPGHSMTLKGAMHTPIDGRAEPQWAAPAMAEAARDAGAVILTGCAVRTVETSAGVVSGVVTERGAIACDAVVVAGGAWSRLFAGNAGVDLPQLKVLNTVMRTDPVSDGPEVCMWSDDFALRKRADGGYTVAAGDENVVDLVPDSFRLARAFLPALRAEWRALSFRLSFRSSGRWRAETAMARRWASTDISPFERCRILDPMPEAKHLAQVWKDACAGFGQLEKAQVVQSWAGFIDVTPDAIPIISGVEGRPGLFIATGFSGHGFGIAPGAGRLVADLVTGVDPGIDPHAFRLSRFTDGSKISLDAER